MASTISLFPTYSEYNTYNFDISLGEYKFYYTTSKGELMFLETEDVEESKNIKKVVDSTGTWNPDEYNLRITNTFYIRSCGHLFGENGIAPSTSTIGLAVMWKSSDSKQRGIIPVGGFNQFIAENESFKLQYDFGVASIRGNVTFTPVLYIKESGNPTKKEKFLANEEGTIVGSFEDYTISLDGKGSNFPVYYINDKTGPLWTVKCDWEDPAQDDFYEYIGIYLNRAHKNFKYIDNSTKVYNLTLVNEIMASALTIIILKLHSDDDAWADTVNGKGNLGSVSEAVNYFINTLEWDVSKPENLSMSIRQYLDQRM